MRVDKNVKQLRKYLSSKGLICKTTAYKQFVEPKKGFAKIGYDFMRLALKGDWIGVQALVNEIREFKK